MNRDQNQPANKSLHLSTPLPQDARVLPPQVASAAESYGTLKHIMSVFIRLSFYLISSDFQPVTAGQHRRRVCVCVCSHAENIAYLLGTYVEESTH